MRQFRIPCKLIVFLYHLFAVLPVRRLTHIYAVNALPRQGSAAGLHYTGCTVNPDMTGGIHALRYGPAHARTVWSFARSNRMQPQCPRKVGKQMIFRSVSISGL